MSHAVTVQYYKYPDTLHWRHELIMLGEDRHGVWLGGPVGTTIQRGAEPAHTMRRPFAQLIVPDVWWTAIFNDPVDHDIAVYVDVTTAASWVTPDRVELIDLDLDVVQRKDGSIYVDDEDEFEEHRVTLGYPARLVAAARTAAARLVLDLERGVAPFDGSARRWLDMVT